MLVAVIAKGGEKDVKKVWRRNLVNGCLRKKFQFKMTNFHAGPIIIQF